VLNGVGAEIKLLANALPFTSKNLPLAENKNKIDDNLIMPLLQA
jgi:hypothetical protein